MQPIDELNLIGLMEILDYKNLGREGLKDGGIDSKYANKHSQYIEDLKVWYSRDQNAKDTPPPSPPKPHLSNYNGVRLGLYIYHLKQFIKLNRNFLSLPTFALDRIIRPPLFVMDAKDNVRSRSCCSTSDTNRPRHIPFISDKSKNVRSTSRGRKNMSYERTIQKRLKNKAIKAWSQDIEDNKKIVTLIYLAVQSFCVPFPEELLDNGWQRHLKDNSAQLAQCEKTLVKARNVVAISIVVICIATIILSLVTLDSLEVLRLQHIRKNRVYLARFSTVVIILIDHTMRKANVDWHQAMCYINNYNYTREENIYKAKLMHQYVVKVACKHVAIIALDKVATQLEEFFLKEMGGDHQNSYMYYVLLTVLSMQRKFMERLVIDPDEIEDQEIISTTNTAFREFSPDCSKMAEQVCQIRERFNRRHVLLNVRPQIDNRILRKHMERADKNFIATCGALTCQSMFSYFIRFQYGCIPSLVCDQHYYPEVVARKYRTAGHHFGNLIPVNFNYQV